MVRNLYSSIDNCGGFNLSLEHIKYVTESEEAKNIADKYVKELSIASKIYMVIYMIPTNEKVTNARFNYRTFASKELAIRFYYELISEGYIADWSKVDVYE